MRRSEWSRVESTSNNYVIIEIHEILLILGQKKSTEDMNESINLNMKRLHSNSFQHFFA